MLVTDKNKIALFSKNKLGNYFEFCAENKNFFEVLPKLQNTSNTSCEDVQQLGQMLLFLCSPKEIVKTKSKLGFDEIQSLKLPAFMPQSKHSQHKSSEEKQTGEEIKISAFYSLDLNELIKQMIAFDPKKRPSPEKILK